MTDSVLCRRDGSTLVITMNRPEVRNAVDGSVASGVAAALDELDEDRSLRVGVLTGAAGTFSAGMDLKAFLAGERPEVPGRGLAGLTESQPRKPLIAAVEGHALAGGCELVLACDIVVAAQDASFGIPEVKRGLIAGSGGLLRLPARIPSGIAVEYALTGRTMPAVEAHRWGLVNRLVGSGEALSGALEIAAEIAANGPLAVRTTKQVIRESKSLPTASAWDRQRELLGVVLASADAREGAAAFVEKRQPHWLGE
ncbi:crotonase/enoyl-CoA hydratase family protein [Protofrankia coriariae]|uniref:Enoyl-CoA hydratase n=1 Tax=Protofrankia coriariae TaxID=1562887 RepID=A0ABR5F1N2_9ACTN|nr:crotonase/enoyl-CoA hydratase family protein [Protofrankia coriariae]KLL10620.1 enoyl-CoA hydratase [Protofrankia coriariae]